MARLFSPIPVGRWRKGYRFYLALSWLSGLACGFLFYLSVDDSVLSLMRSAPYAPVSIVGLLCVTLFPVLLSALAVFLSSFICLLPVCFVKAFLFIFVSLGVCQAYASAGWLIRILLLFSECLSVPVLYWFWLHKLSQPPRSDVWETVWILSLLTLIGSIHICVISPVLARLIEF